MAKFNLDDYENVYERKKRFYAEHQEGRITTEIVQSTMDLCLVKCYIYISSSEIPKATGHAFEFRDKEMKKNKYGNDYESVNYSCWVENCETSAIGRALSNAGYSSNDKCTREEMQKVQNHSNVKQESRKLLVDLTPITKAKEALSLDDNQVYTIIKKLYNHQDPYKLTQEMVAKVVEEMAK